MLNDTTMAENPAQEIEEMEVKRREYMIKEILPAYKNGLVKLNQLDGWFLCHGIAISPNGIGYDANGKRLGKMDTSDCVWYQGDRI